jgi:hypothetical protein
MGAIPTMPSGPARTMLCGPVSEVAAGAAG